MARLVEQDPHYEELNQLLTKNKNRRTKAEIYELWVKMIKPDAPTVTLTQFINWTRSYGNDVDRGIENAQREDIDMIEAARGATIVQIESQLRGVTAGLVGEAADIMKNHAEEGMPLKERYFALTIVDKIWGKVIKEKEIAIKAHAEKRESVGLFAKLLRGAMAGEFTMKDLEMLKQTRNNDDTQGTSGAEESA